VGDDPPLALVEAQAKPPVEHLVDGVVELDVEATFLHPPADGWPYTSSQTAENASASGPPAPVSSGLRLMPYHRWGNRGPATMRVWLPTG
jgi:uncharacterized protein